ncbi:MAG: BatA domain-containing protein [Phycisphaerales bacterium]|nr:BatA domain-containing protein [Phycisphaerales bacterium]
MLIFAWPMMLGVAGGVAALGMLALWRGERGRQRVSSTKLWEGLVETAAGGKRRAMDPVWVMIFAGALLGTLAAAGPGWQMKKTGGGAAMEMHVEWSVRSVGGRGGGGDPGLFLRVLKAGGGGHRGWELESKKPKPRTKK